MRRVVCTDPSDLGVIYLAVRKTVWINEIAFV